ncbi:hypothetical protein KCU73_g896, partial [Aureobasidium melanogenum]
MSHATEAEEAFARTKDKIAHKLKAAFELKSDPDKSFLPVEKAKDIILNFMSDDLRELCRRAGDDDLEPPSVFSNLTTNERRKDHMCLMLAVLLCIDGFSLVQWRQFREFLKGSFTDLPLDSVVVNEVFGSGFGQLFYDKQFAFCPVILEERKINNYTRMKSRCKLPYLEEIKIGSGSFGTVYKVRIPRGHLQGRYYNTTALARKDFRIAAQGRESFQKEWETMQRILQAKDLHANIMRTFASLELDSQLSIFYRLAKCNLAEYLNNSKGMSATFCSRLDSGAEAYHAKRELFIQVKDLAEALKTLHHFQNKDATMASCFHMDLKPENILVCVQDDGSEIWKISDFGISRVEKIKDQASNARMTLDLNNIFVRNRNDSQTQITAPGGGGTYMAPEAVNSETKVTNVCDVWSLACVVLVVMSFAHGGPGEVKSLHDGLLANGRDSDRFFVKKDTKKYSLPFIPKKTYKGRNEEGDSTLYVQNPYIEKCLDRWSSKPQDSCKEFYRALSKLLLDEALLPDPKKRIDASTFSDSFSNCFTKHLPGSYDKSKGGGARDKPWVSREFGVLQSVPLAHAMVNSGLANSVAFIAPFDLYVYEISPPHRELLFRLKPPPETHWSCCALSHDLLCVAIDSAGGAFQVRINEP